MKKNLLLPGVLVLILAASLLLPSCRTLPEEPLPEPCTEAWYALVESKMQILDESGHGPDVGSLEWMQAVDFKAGISDGAGHGPDLGSGEWCQAVHRKVVLQ